MNKDLDAIFQMAAISASMSEGAMRPRRRFSHASMLDKEQQKERKKKNKAAQKARRKQHKK